jgi:AcrR family transcriptional regulator
MPSIRNLRGAPFVGYIRIAGWTPTKHMGDGRLHRQSCGNLERVLKATAQGADIRTRILDAAFQTVRTEGVARASARTIARNGGFNQALIFYHFGSIDDLLLAALDRSAAARMARYREVLSGATPAEFASLARRLYVEDVEAGHATVLAKLFAACGGNPALGAEMLRRLQPWLELAESLIQRLLAGLPFETLVDARAAAGAVLAMYVGIDLLNHLDGNRSRATDLFDSGERLATAFAPWFGGPKS